MPARDCPITVAYERLRNHALEAPSPGGHFGLIVLLREGLAAWAARCGERCGANDIGPSMSVVAQATSSIHFDDALKTNLVNVLANLIEPTLAAPEAQT